MARSVEINKRYSGLTFLTVTLICVVASVTTLAYGSSPTHEQASLFRMLQQSLLAYRQKEGTYPCEFDYGEKQSWYQALVSSGLAPQSSIIHVTECGRWPLDVYGNPIIYELYQSDNGSIKVALRSVGADGIDNNGMGDDWDTRYGVNWGYWHKQRYPKAAFIAGTAVVFIVALMMYRKSRRPDVLAAAIGTFSIGIPFVADPYLFSSAQTSPKWFEVVAVGGVVFLLSSLGLLCAKVIQFAVVARRVRLRQCAACGYSLHGLTSQFCPECGRKIGNST